MSSPFETEIRFQRKRGGDHPLYMTFVLRGPSGAITWQVYTGWPPVVDDAEGWPPRLPCDNGLQYHSPVQLPDRTGPASESKCDVLGPDHDGPCYSSSWFVDSRDLLHDFMRSGNVEEVWSELRYKYTAVFGYPEEGGDPE